ncbi:aminoglycoside phosphotransferase family protein [Shouchella clausii]|uniref:aminoglycoside phosphotransferase family protein n=1 Tax=Shouchella clausii TaxID=79880 RepID=UPI0031FDD0EB
MEPTIELARKLIDEQFPEWSNLEIKHVQKSGHDNRTFRLGATMSIRLPIHEAYAPQVEKEAKWLPMLAPHFDLPITVPIAKGKPSRLYPYSWSVNRWIEGQTLNRSNVHLQRLAVDLAAFLKKLYSIDSTGGPTAGKHNFFRGGDLAVYKRETERAIAMLGEQIDGDACAHVFKEALSSKWSKPSVWVHGDVAPGNLLVKNRKLAGVIDFGSSGVGDPACDLVMAWTFFDKDSRIVFKEEIGLDADTWNRGKGWALWKALITYNSEVDEVRQNAHFTIKEILHD